MKAFNKLRWERIQESKFSFEEIKKYIKKIFNCEIKESSLTELLSRIDKYENINEELLISHIEPLIYKKVIIYSMKDLKKYDVHPIINTLSENPLEKEYFKSHNRINLASRQFYEGDLGSVYKIIYYDDTKNDIFEIRMACIKELEIKSIHNLSVMSTRNINVYDSIKIIINLREGLVSIFYNDIPESKEKDKDNTQRKSDFSSLFFGKVTKNNLVKYTIAYELTEYINRYLREEEDGKSTKLVQTIELRGILKLKSEDRSSEEDFIHNKNTLKGIKEKLDSGSYKVAILECNIKSKMVKFKDDGEIVLYYSTFQPEVIEDVCKEVFNGYNPFE